MYISYILHFAALAQDLHIIGVLTTLSLLRYKNIRFVELVGNGTVGAMEFCTKDLGVKARANGGVCNSAPRWQATLNSQKG